MSGVQSEHWWVLVRALPKAEHWKVEGSRNFSVKTNNQSAGHHRNDDITDNTERDQNREESKVQMEACNNGNDIMIVESSAYQTTWRRKVQRLRSVSYQIARQKLQLKKSIWTDDVKDERITFGYERRAFGVLGM
jgi:hypothetical protein